jgi:cobyrinic acid a,c-diamide synthase
VKIAGVVLNRLGSERHRRLAGDAIEALGMPVVGAIMRDPSLTLPERHLGLVQAGEHQDIGAHIDRLADMVEKSLDIDKVLGLMTSLDPRGGDFSAALPPPGQRIALAEDAAFSFLYPHVARHWRKAGAEIAPFSPLADEAPDASCDVCWLPGGYPELHAGKLAAAQKFRDGIGKFAETKPVHGECGGFMVLGQGLVDADGERHQMLGLLGHATSFAKRKMNLGYRQARLMAGSALGPAGARVRGHEFHYAQMIEPGADEPLAEIADGQGNPLGASGGRRGLVSGTFFHAIARADA